MDENPDPGAIARGEHQPTAAGKALGVTPADRAGLLHDRDVLACYGDPALDARMHARPCAYDQALACTGDVWTLTVAAHARSPRSTPTARSAEAGRSSSSSPTASNSPNCSRAPNGPP